MDRVLQFNHWIGWPAGWSDSKRNSKEPLRIQYFAGCPHAFLSEYNLRNPTMAVSGRCRSCEHVSFAMILGDMSKLILLCCKQVCPSLKNHTPFVLKRVHTTSHGNLICQKKHRSTSKIHAIERSNPLAQKQADCHRLW